MQLVLPVTFTKQNGFNTLVEGANTQLVKHLQARLELPFQKSQASQGLCFVDGITGSGKTHLLLAISEQANRMGMSTQYVNMSTMVNMPLEMLEGVASNQVLCIDDIQAIQSSEKWQRGLFDLINQFLEQSHPLLLMAANVPLNQLSIGLADLGTRLQWGVNFSIRELDDAEKHLALAKHAQALGFKFDDDAAKYLISRASRSMPDLMSNLDRLDKASLQNKRKITIPFIKSVLDF